MNLVDKANKNIPFANTLYGNQENSSGNTVVKKRNEIFKDVAEKRQDKLNNLSVTKNFFFPKDSEDSPFGHAGHSNPYSNVVNKSLDHQKDKRLLEFRQMAIYPIVSDALDEICDEALTKNEGFEQTLEKNRSPLNFRCTGDHTDEIKDELRNEFKKFVAPLEISKRGWNFFRELLVEGELFFECIISSEEPERGILGFKKIPTELVDAQYDNFENETIKNFRVKKPTKKTGTTGYSGNSQYIQSAISQGQEILLNKAQVMYAHSGHWDHTKTYKVPFINEARQDYTRLTLIKDSIVIYRLVRAPERLVFNLRTGNMSRPQQEQYLKQFEQEYRSRRVIGADGKISSQYDPVSMIEDFFFAVGKDDTPSDVKSISTGANLGELNDLLYFTGEVYKRLKVPVSRLSAEQQAMDAASITRDELRFAKSVIRIQEQFSTAIKDTFITHLKLRQITSGIEHENVSEEVVVNRHLMLLEQNDGEDYKQYEDGSKDKSLWEQYDLNEEDIEVWFNIPTNFLALRDQQMFELKLNNYSTLANDVNISNTMIQKEIIGWSDRKILENLERLKMEAEAAWEIANIAENGPDFREKLEAELAAGEGGMGGGEAGGGGFPEMGGAGAEPALGDIGGEGGAPEPVEGGGAETLPGFGGDVPPEATGEEEA